jgi:hypothetical protein
MVNEAAHFWLGLCAQPCRFVITVPPSAENLLAWKGEYSNQVLVVEPKIERYGTAQGEQLEHVEVLRNCEGKIEQLDS